MPPASWTRLLRLPKATILRFIEHDCPAQAAALAYYTVFSLPPLLLIAVAVAGLAFETPAVVNTIYTEIRATLGNHAADQVVQVLSVAQGSTTRGGPVEVMIGLFMLAFSASGAFAQLQASLNRIWEVKPDPNANEIRGFLLKRVVSFGMVVSLGFLLMVSLVLSAALAAFSSFIQAFLPAGLSTAFLQSLNYVASLGLFALLFAAIFRFLPDAKLGWRDVATGGWITSILFVAGRFGIGFYLSRSEVTTAFGAAGSLAIILVWTYYASMMVLLGAEFTRSWSAHCGHKPEPEDGAVRVKQKEVRVPS